MYKDMYKGMYNIKDKWFFYRKPATEELTDRKAKIKAVAEMPCILCGAKTRRIHYIFKRGEVKQDWDRIIPLCSIHSREFEDRSVMSWLVMYEEPDKLLAKVDAWLNASNGVNLPDNMEAEQVMDVIIYIHALIGLPEQGQKMMREHLLHNKRGEFAPLYNEWRSMQKGLRLHEFKPSEVKEINRLARLEK